MAHTLSKSDFVTARDCPSKLYYKKKRYPSTRDDDAFMELLADGGYMIEAIAKCLYPGAQEMDYRGAKAETAARTLDALRAERVTLMEATLLAGMKLARVDILVKDGVRFDLIEVKAKSFDSSVPGVIGADGVARLPRGARGALQGDWSGKLDDIAFQVCVLKELFPTAEIRPFLSLPDKAKTSTIDVIHQHFRVKREEVDGFERVRAEFTGDVEALRQSHFLTLVDVSVEVAALLPEVEEQAKRFEASVTPELTRIVEPIAVRCHTCEYRVKAGVAPSGFLECWGEAGAPSPHVLDLYMAGQRPTRAYVEELIAARRTSLFDVDERRLVTASGEPGAHNRRQLVQIRHTRADTEWADPELGKFLNSCSYPLHFIDFETSQLAVPYHAGMHPYERVAFQWSCHTIGAPGEAPVHTEWINTEDFFPNFEFARTLRAQLGEGGTVFMWHIHEQSTLRLIREQMSKRAEADPDLGAYLESLASRLVDLNAACAKWYFHPIMGKRTSIKNVLEAVWTSDPLVRAAFPQYASAEKSPYAALPAALVGDEEMEVAGGTGAVTAYQEMMYGSMRNDPVERGKIREMLLRYCELDTAAMVMIWQHWGRITAAT